MAKDVTGLSLRAYAAYRKRAGLPGGTLQAVQKAVASKRIDPPANGKIDPAVADAQWAARSKPVLAKAPVPQIDPEKPEKPADSPIQAVDSTPRADILRSQARVALVEAEEKEFEWRRRRGEFIEASDVAATQESIAMSEREALLNLPSRYSADLAAELGCEERKVYVALNRIIRRHLAERSTKLAGTATAA